MQLTYYSLKISSFTVNHKNIPQDMLGQLNLIDYTLLTAPTYNP